MGKRNPVNKKGIRKNRPRHILKSIKAPVQEDIGSPIHLRFDYYEALNSKKEILYSQRSMVMIESAMREYFNLKAREVETKEILHKKLGEAIKYINKIQKIIPPVKLPPILKNNNESEEEPKEIISKKTPSPGKEMHNNSIEYQLQDIQNKLNELQKS